MEFDIDRSIEILERTPHVLEDLLKGLSDDWTMYNEGGDTWSPYDVVGHLIHAEKVNWVARMDRILLDGNNRFEQFDRLAQFKESKGKSLSTLLAEFKILRKESIVTLRRKNITSADLMKKGIHPAFGEVTLRQLLSAWVVHDFTHLAQIVRVMAKQYKEETGPWIEFLSVLKK